VGDVVVVMLVVVERKEEKEGRDDREVSIANSGGMRYGRRNGWVRLAECMPACTRRCDEARVLGWPRTNRWVVGVVRLGWIIRHSTLYRTVPT
jgi:hypothetical protein